jgi:thymidylate synthase
MTDYDPSIADQGVLYPCHSLIIQFYVSKGIYLDMTCYNRSSDLFLGLPFNIASSALFLTIIAKITGLIPRNFHLNLGDSHIYENHYSAVLSQIERFPYKLPSLIIHKQLNTITDAETLNYTDFELIRYQCYPRISAEMVA